MRLSVLIEGLSIATHPTTVMIKEAGFLVEFTPTNEVNAKNPVSGHASVSPESHFNRYILLIILCTISTPVTACQPNSPNSATFRKM